MIDIDWNVVNAMMTDRERIMTGTSTNGISLQVMTGRETIIGTWNGKGTTTTHDTKITVEGNSG